MPMPLSVMERLGASFLCIEVSVTTRVRRPNATTMFWVGLPALAVLGLAVAWWLVGRDVAPLSSWQDDTGATVSSETVKAFNGGRHCGWESATILWVDAGLVAEVGLETSAPTAFFVRDPQGVVSAELLGEYAVQSELPDGAVRSGLSTTGGTELWFGRDGRSALLVNAGGVEVWPRAKGAVMCG